MTMTNRRMSEYLEDPFLARMFNEVRAAGPLRSILVDITHLCNLRCEGCYFFSHDMDRFKAPKDEAEFDEFLDREQARGTNYVTVVGGEPTIVMDRLKKIYDRFWTMPATNGLHKIPYEGFENLPVAISVWGDHATDTQLRGRGKLDVFARALANYRDDPRAVWYFTISAHNADQIERVVEECVGNGNYVAFNFYSDTSESKVDRRAFAQARRETERVIERYPDRILGSSYINDVVFTGKLYDDEWGYDVCSTLTFDHPENQERFKNGKPYNTHFRVFYPDLKTTRRCCVGEAGTCSTCVHLLAYTAWIMVNLEKHLGSKQEFTNWLTTIYIHYLTGRIIDFEAGAKLLPEIHRRTSPEARASVHRPPVPAQPAALHLGA